MTLFWTLLRREKAMVQQRRSNVQKSKLVIQSYIFMRK